MQIVYLSQCMRLTVLCKNKLQSDYIFLISLGKVVCLGFGLFSSVVRGGMHFYEFRTMHDSQGKYFTFVMSYIGISKKYVIGAG